MSQRYEKIFAGLRKHDEGAFIPFVTLGDPNAEESEAIAETLIEAGADALELGIPFSDPVADGPVIQAAGNRALESGATPDSCFEILARVRKKYPDVPMGLLVYANLVIGRGIERFYSRAAESGVDSVLIADVPVLAARPFSEQAQRAGIDPVYIVPPNADDGKLREIAALTKGYTYFLGRSGVTGTEHEMKTPLASKIRLLKDAGAPPVIVGFGISRPEHVIAAINAGADGAIAGSATVALIAASLGDAKKTREELAAFVRGMKSATRK
ncbi:MAG: tryptophan synthase subunit alpha [Synergistaceae bacterium]|jgi:tryptophan synthase alpha chain|nr:tryptophan synthase subunit alpha [Synergistaceae bacterium]